MKSLSAAAVALAALGCSNYMKVDVEGRVVDVAGRPVPGARVTTQILGVVGYEPVFLQADGEGRFEGTLPRSTGAEQAIFASLPLDKRGGFVVLPSEEAAGLEIVIQPLVPVKARVDTEDIPARSRASGIYASALTAGDRQALVARGGTDPNVTFRLPPGRYSLSITSGGKPKFHPFEVGTEEVDLGVVKVEPYKIQTLVDREAPDLFVADAQGLSRNFRLRDFRGKWIVLFFWNHHMQSNTFMLPNLVKFGEDHKHRAADFEIVLVYGADDVLTVRDIAWGFKEVPPLQVIVDDRDRSFEAYGLERGPQFRSAPTQFLIDPEGKVVLYGFDVLRRLKNELEAK